MSFVTSMFRLPCGVRAGRVEWQGQITGELARTAVVQAGPGGAMHGVPVLVIHTRDVTMTSEARAVFASQKDMEWTALVFHGVLLRVTANFIIRISGNDRLRLFATEPEAKIGRAS